MTSGVYMIRHAATGRVYVGSAVKLSRRLRDHRRDLDRGLHLNRRLQSAWDESGAGAFEWEVVEAIEPAKLLVREQHWIDLLQAADARYGYNINKIAGSVLGLRHSVEAREKIRAAHIGKRKNPDAIAKTAAANRGRKMPTAAIEAAVRTKQSLGSNRHTEESRAKISAALVGRKQSAVWIARSAAARTGGKRSLETRQRLSLALSRYWHQNWAAREKMAVVHRGKIVAQEVRQRISATLRKRQA